MLHLSKEWVIMTKREYTEQSNLKTVMPSGEKDKPN
jgi:hypothetical protein